MDLRREIVTMIGLLVGLCVLLAFGAVGLLGRMGPAIDEILRANVYSMAAAEEVLVVLADAGGEAVTLAEREKIAAALERIEHNITEAPERPVVAAIEAWLPAAMAAPGPARRTVSAQLGHLVEINRGAMRRADADARRLGSAGAWASALLGVLAFVIGLLVLRRARARVVAPILDLDEVLAGVRGGQVLRRARILEAPDELVRVGAVVNELLDARESRQRRPPQDLAAPLASALQGLLEERPAATFVVDREGAILRANERGMELLAGEGGAAAREALREAARGGATPAGVEARPLSNQLGSICTWTGAPPGPERPRRRPATPTAAAASARDS